jgi:dTDP-glucose pyrophosphorylase
MKRDLDALMIRPGASLREAMVAIDQGSAAIALVVGSEGYLVGVLSDGDIRRALIHGASLNEPVDPYVSKDPAVLPGGFDRAAALDLMRARRLSQIPEVDAEGRLIGLHVLHEVLGADGKNNWAIVLAGGRGTRLGEFTAETPKPMLRVAGRPILERLILHLVGSGVERIFLSVNYLAEQIEGHFKDGADFGCSIEYLREDPAKPLGTGGPLRLLRDQIGLPASPVVVANGDLVVSFSLRSLLQAHDEAEAAMTVALKEYDHEVPYGVANLRSDDSRFIKELVEKPRWWGLVNAGIYVVDPRLLDMVPPDCPYPLTDLASNCLRKGERVAGWQLAEEWHDIGRPDELQKARGESW